MVVNSAITRVAACQLDLAVGQVETNLERAQKAVEAAAANGAQLVVLPELVRSGYVFDSVEEAMSLGERCDGPSIRLWADLAAQHDLVIVGGFCERQGHDVLYNSGAVIDRGRLVGVYRKAHLWDREKAIFRTGNEPPLVVDTSVGRVGVMICYDAEFPEWTRQAALRGAAVLALPTNWPVEARPAGERPMETVRLQAAAAANRVFIVAADRCGDERGQAWVGGSVVMDTTGFPLAGGDSLRTERVLCADVHLGRSNDKWVSANNHVFLDRRPELYTTNAEWTRGG